MLHLVQILVHFANPLAASTTEKADIFARDAKVCLTFQPRENGGRISDAAACSLFEQFPQIVTERKLETGQECFQR